MKILMLMIAAAVAGPELAFAQITEDSRCAEQPKTFDLENNGTSIQSLQILKGNEFVMHAKTGPKDDLKLNCGGGSGQQINPSWQSEQTARNASQEIVMAPWTLLTMSYTKNLVAHRAEEMPLRTHITVSSLGNYLSLKDIGAAHSADVWMECTDGMIKLTDMEAFPHKPFFSFPIPVKATTGGDPSAAAAPAASCKPTNYVIDMATGKIREGTASSARAGANSRTGGTDAPGGQR